MKINPLSYLYLFVVGAFLIVTGHLMFAKTMFMDGLFYTTIARNISVGDCTVWDLKFTNTFYSNFHEHPPLAMWLESVYFDVFGTSWVVDKFYSVSTYFFTAFFIHKIWKTIYPTSQLSWVAILFWLFTPVVFWAVGNNLLENTMSIFLIISVYYSLKTVLTNKWYYSIISGFFIALGFLTKGFVAFFPLSFFFIYFLIFKDFKIKLMIRNSILIIIGTLLPLVLLFSFNHTAYLSIKSYFDIQVVNSLNNIVTVDSRFFIVKRLLSELLVIFFLIVVLYFITSKAKINLSKNSFERKWFLFFTLFGLTGVLPIIVTLKQSGFYILPVYPLFSIAFVSLFNKRLTFFHDKIVSSLITRYVSIVVFLCGFTMVLFSFSSYGNDSEIVKDIEIISKYVKKGEIIDSPTTMSDDFSIHAYLYRMNFISLRSDSEVKNNFYIINLEQDPINKIPNGYKLIPLKTEVLKLYKKVKFI